MHHEARRAHRTNGGRRPLETAPEPRDHGRGNGGRAGDHGLAYCRDVRAGLLREEQILIAPRLASLAKASSKTLRSHMPRLVDALDRVVQGSALGLLKVFTSLWDTFSSEYDIFGCADEGLRTM